MNFHNPYQFVPAAPRAADGPFGDSTPVGHNRLHAERWTGQLAVTLTTVTPLLVPDVAEDAGGGHQRHGTRVRPDADGADRVYLPPTSVKGMLRAAYEAVTNSRMGVFTQREVLGYRSEARSGLDAKPVLVRIAPDGSPQVAMSAAWLHTDQHAQVVRPVTVPSYGKWCLYPDESAPRHGDRAVAWVELVRRQRERGTYWYWRASRMWRAGTDPDQPPPDELGKLAIGHHVAVGPWALVRGIMHRTNQNINGKHDERLFILECLDSETSVQVQSRERLTLPSEVWTAYRRLIADYRQQHRTERRDDIWAGRRPRKPWEVPGGDDFAWSRHLYDVLGPHAPTGLSDAEIAAQGPDMLRADGWVTCYGIVEDAKIAELIPVVISRRLHGRTPSELLRGKRVAPAASMAELSMADRVFGWVRQPRPGERASPAEGRDLAVRGALRVGPVRGPLAADGVTEVNVPLEVLSAPKPSQGRFYVGVKGSDEMPKPMPRSAAKDTFFNADRVLRGRKVYPHQRIREADEAYWDPGHGPVKDKEYRRLGDRTDDQNRTVTNWVRPRQTFHFNIHVRNLNSLELGALLWLLDPVRFGEPNRPGRHRLGLGKPLGFGSVEVALADDGHDLRRGQDWAADFASLGAVSAAGVESWRTLAAEFEDEMSSTEHGVVILHAVRAAAIGYEGDAPVHYPRTRADRDSDGKNYEWFVANENGDRRALPLLGEPAPPDGNGTTLPYNRRPGNGQRGQRRSR